MNIFFLSSDQKECVQWYVDRHVTKMITETAQMLCTNFMLLGGKSCNILFLPTHTNHPCTAWVRKSKENYLWTLKLLKEQIKEYDHRYGNNKYQREREILTYISLRIEQLKFNNYCLTQPALAMPEYCKTDTPEQSYKNYYIKEKSHLAKWTKRNRPIWYKEN